MATLVLTTIGTALGGPIGGLIGAVAGQAADQRLLGPRGREGPRLTDLRIQTSSYGSAILHIYGQMRVAGTVIWATDLIEERQRQSAGKGQPKGTSYSYSASFAVALSSRPIRSIGRIWAEGNLLRGAAGDFKQRVTMRLHTGDADQPVDPLIAAAEGMAAAPAYRGIAYVVFEALDLAPFGNRIPSLTFEVVADDGVLTVQSVVRDLIGDAQVGSGGQALAGFAAIGPTRADSVRPLLAIETVRRATTGARWMVGDDDAPTVVLDVAADDRGEPRGHMTRRALAQAPGQIMFNYFDPARDYQLAVQQVRVAGGGRESDAIALPIAMQASDARTQAERLASIQQRQSEAEDWPTGFAGLLAQPGQCVTRAAPVRVSCVAERRIEGATVRLNLTPDRTTLVQPTTYPADPGRGVYAPDAPVGTTVGALFDLPAWAAGEGGQARLILAATGAGAAWRNAAASISATVDGTRVPVGPLSSVAVLGHIVAIENGEPTAMVHDGRSSIQVQLVRSDMLMSNAATADLLAGANIAAIGGGEIIQFGRAEQIGPALWQLSDLLRGRFGTEEAMALTAAGQALVLLDDPALLPMPATAGVAPIGVGAAVRVQGVADADEQVMVVAAYGRAQRPLSPVHCTASLRDDGGIDLRWIRRSRAGFDWPDGVETPLDEPFERYRVEIVVAGTTLSHSSESAGLTIATTDIAAWRTAGVTMGTVAIRQCGQFAESLPTVITVHW